MRRVRWGRALAAGVLGSLALTAVSPAHAAWVKSYDGSWSVSLVSDAEDIFDGHNVLLDPAHDDLSISENDQVVQLTATDRDTTRDFSVYLDVPPSHTFGTGVYSAEANGDPVAMETTGTGPARVGVDNDGGSCSGDTWLDVRDFHQTNGLSTACWPRSSSSASTPLAP